VVVAHDLTWGLRRYASASSLDVVDARMLGSTLRAALKAAFDSLEEAIVVIEQWCKHYDTIRPYSRASQLSPGFGFRDSLLPSSC
jgi:hypothetical protein